MNNLKIEKIKESIKVLLKKQGVTYEELGKNLDCSVPTVKRILGKEELTLTRLMDICEYLELSLSDLEAMANSITKERKKLTYEQEHFLAKNPNFLSYFLCLFSKKTPEDIQKEYKLTKLSTEKYLIKLEQLELIKVTNAGIVKPTFEDFPSFENGPLAKANMGRFIDNGANFFKGWISDQINKDDKSKDDDSFPQGFTFQAIKLTKETFANWCKEHQKRLDELHYLSRIEEKTKPDDQLETCAIMQATALAKKGDRNIEQLKDVYSDICEI